MTTVRKEFFQITIITHHNNDRVENAKANCSYCIWAIKYNDREAVRQARRDSNVYCNRRIWKVMKTSAGNKKYPERKTFGKVTVWGMIGWERLLGMRILDEIVTDERYCDILDEIMVPVMQSAEHEPCLLQQDGAPPYYATTAREVLSRDLQNEWEDEARKNG